VPRAKWRQPLGRKVLSKLYLILAAAGIWFFVEGAIYGDRSPTSCGAMAARLSEMSSRDVAFAGLAQPSSGAALLVFAVRGIEPVATGRKRHTETRYVQLIQTLQEPPASARISGTRQPLVSLPPLSLPCFSQGSLSAAP